MKKKFSICIAAVGMTVVSAFSYKSFCIDADHFDLLTENVEALTNDESSGTRYKCYSSTHYKENACVVFCDDCKMHRHQTDDLFCTHDWCYR